MIQVLTVIGILLFNLSVQAANHWGDYIDGEGSGSGYPDWIFPTLICLAVWGLITRETEHRGVSEMKSSVITWCSGILAFIVWIVLVAY